MNNAPESDLPAGAFGSSPQGGSFSRAPAARQDARLHPAPCWEEV